MSRKRQGPPIQVHPKMVERVQAVSLDELFTWSDTLISELVRHFSGYRGGRDPDQLEEAKLCVQGIYATLDELSHRRPGVPPERPARQPRSWKPSGRLPKGRVT